MGSESSDRARMRDDLRQLARMASSDAPSTPHPGLATADSSGYVDLSALTSIDEADEGWVERELARAGARPRTPALAPGSMAPVAIASLLQTEPDLARTKAKKRTWVYSGLVFAGVGIVAVLAVAVTRNAPLSLLRRAPQSAPVPAVAAAPPPTVAPVAPVAAEAPAPGPTETASAAPVTPAKATTAAADTAPPKKAAASRAHASPAPPPAAHAAVAAAPRPPPAAIPAAPAKKGGSGGDSLMDMMRASVGTPGKK